MCVGETEYYNKYCAFMSVLLFTYYLSLTVFQVEKLGQSCFVDE